MIALPRPKRGNDSALARLAKALPELAAVKGIVLGRYTAYRADRDPAKLLPMKLGSKVADWLRDQYRSGKKSMGLSWIKEQREGHGLVYCPMCGGTGPGVLDHLLPKEDYPEFSVFAENLVPSCDPCNRRRARKGAKLHLVHPYFDHALIANLHLTVLFRPPYDGVTFKIVAPGLSPAEWTRLSAQIEETLPRLAFDRRALSLWGRWHRTCFRDKVDATKSHLARFLDDIAPIERNSWEAAFVRGLMIDDKALQWMAATPPDAPPV